MGNCCSLKKKPKNNTKTHNALDTANPQNESRQADAKDDFVENVKGGAKHTDNPIEVNTCDVKDNSCPNPENDPKISVEKERKLIFSFDLDTYYRKDETKVIIDEIVKEYRAFVGVNQLNLNDLTENQLLWKSLFELRELYSKVFFCQTFSRDLSKGLYKDKSNLSSKLADSTDIDEYYQLAKDIILKNNKIFYEQIENSQMEEKYDRDVLMLSKLKSCSVDDQLIDTLRKEYERIEKLIKDKSNKLHGLENENSLISKIRLSRKIEIVEKGNTKPNLQVRLPTSESSKKILQKSATPKSVKKASILESENEEDEEKKTFGDIF